MKWIYSLRYLSVYIRVNISVRSRFNVSELSGEVLTVAYGLMNSLGTYLNSNVSLIIYVTLFLRELMLIQHQEDLG